MLKAAEALAEAPALEEAEAPLPVYRPKEENGKDFHMRTKGTPTKWRHLRAGIERGRVHDVLGTRRFGAPLPKNHGGARRGPGIREAGVKDGDTVAIRRLRTRMA